ncbi:unnamed protein product [Cladocopium goreaui]|uniref:Uncharacterized protein n=1 Tax=Cladocopium goreaui TaxID=2562237 RepID=A0A9P1GDM9_9DINO|nr:unnamed protein product [Cladocopium goreaui]
MDVVPAESQFATKVVVTWFPLFVGYGVYLNASLGKASGNFEPMNEDSDELDSMGGITSVDGMSSVETSSGDFYSDEDGVEIVGGQPAFSLKVCEMLTLLHHANYEEYEGASNMLHMVDDLSADEDSPNG